MNKHSGIEREKTYCPEDDKYDGDCIQQVVHFDEDQG